MCCSSNDERKRKGGQDGRGLYIHTFLCCQGYVTGSLVSCQSFANHPLRTGSANNRTWGKHMRSFKRIKESNKSPKLKNKMCVGCLWMSSKTCYERSYQQKRVFPKIPPGTSAPCSGSDYTGRGFQKHPWSGSPLGSTENMHLVYFWRKPRQLSTTTVVE